MDQRDPIARIQRLVDNGALELLIPRTDCGMVAATGVIKGNKVIFARNHNNMQYSKAFILVDRDTFTNNPSYKLLSIVVELKGSS
jgi:hypothetical protein